jgi:hypothetical protein
MPAVLLRDIDDSFAERPGPRSVPTMRLKTGGVDPLGLRQINLDLMDESFPGFNNVTTVLRPYTVMAWAWWKAVELAKTNAGGQARIEALRAFVDRADVIYVWSQLLDGRDAELPGKRVLKREVLARSDYTFSGPRWDEVCKVRRYSTGLMAPVQYGPSIRTQSGLGWLTPDAETGALVPVKEVMPGHLGI